MEGFKYEGIWWPSDNPEKRVCGILIYIPNQKTSLYLIGIMDEPKIIQGFSSYGKKITLYKCHQIAEHDSYPGFATSEYTPEIILIGDHFSEVLSFTEISINYSYLDQWLGLSGFKGKEPSNGGIIDIAYKKPKRVETNINDEYNIAIDFSFSYERSLKFVRMNQTANITAKFLEEGL